MGQIDISAAVVTAANQTYTGSALTPTPTVVLDGETIPSTGYDVTYSNNTNAGTATITITGKDDYVGTASGTFTIAKASRTIAFTTAPTSVDVMGTITVVAMPSAGTNDGTITYTSSNTSIATVNGNVVTGVAEGTVTITATISTGTNYKSATTSYNLGVVFNYANQYLTIESLEDDNEIIFVCSTYSTSYIRTIYWSTDMQTWTSVQSTGGNGRVITTLNAGGKIYLRGENNTYGFSSERNAIQTSKKYNLYGNIMSLIYGDAFIGKKSFETNFTFKEFFRPSSVNTGKIVSAENLVLPATTVTYGCYYNMFREQSLMTIAPELPATTLASYCYFYMFYGCTSLNYIKCLATDISATSCTNSWVGKVSATGTFVKDANMASWATGTSGIPRGWTVETASS